MVLGCKTMHPDQIESSAKGDKFLEAVAAVHPKLQQLNLWDCESVTDSGIAAIGAGCPGLQQLNLWGCELVTDSGVAAIATGCPGCSS